MWWIQLLVACQSDPVAPPTRAEPEEPEQVVPFSPAPATLVRVTDAEWRNSAEDLFGVRWEGDLPLDFRLMNYGRVGGSQLTIPPADLDLYEAAAWGVAQAAVPDEAAALALLGADPTDPAALRGSLAPLATRAWRRPVTATELEELAARWEKIRADLGSAIATQGALASLLLSPDFLFRVELGVEDPSRPGWRFLTGWERAARLASFLTASVPDPALLADAESGALDSDVELLVAHAERLLETPRGRAAMADFFAETLQLHELDSVTKDAALYPEFTATLRAQMDQELRDLFLQVALDEGADLRDLLTTDRTAAGPELAALYGVSPSAGTLPAADARGGLLGRAALHTIQSHNTLTSPTERGKFVRTRLLCQSIPPPPAGISTDLEGAEGDTLRDKLAQHATDPSCASCHRLMDPIGFALEHFDPIGRRRELDNGFPIDATGEVDGADFDGAAELGRVIADHPAFTHCLATQLYRYANGTVERDQDDALLDAIDADVIEAGRAFRPLVEAIVRSEGFLTVSAPEGEGCAADGASRACSNACGQGTEVCRNGTWQGCTAPAPAPESCDGRDQDCDGEADQDLVRTCESDFGPGVQACESGAWSACQGPAAPEETCDGTDEDLDGEVDEGLDLRLERFTFDQLRLEGHPDCDAVVDPWSPACHAAAHRGCGARGCAASGFGPVTQTRSEAELTCLGAEHAVVVNSTFTQLSTFHDGCNRGYRQGGACSAAISRMCSSMGMVTGYGPVENFDDLATVVCAPTASVQNSTYTELSALDAGCNSWNGRWGAACDRAIHAWCVGRGFDSGFGPLENSGDLAIVGCVGVE